MSNHLQRAERILKRIDELASISEDKTCITRTYGTAAFIEGRNKVQQWMKGAGLQTTIDNIGNIRGRLKARNGVTKTFVIASHIDTIINAGRFDGPLGVLMGLDLIEQIIESKTEIPFTIELIGFCDEEGCRFHTTYLGSKVVAGSFDQSILSTKDERGNTLNEVMEQNGGSVNELSKDAIAREDRCRSAKRKTHGSNDYPPNPAPRPVRRAAPAKRSRPGRREGGPAARRR